MKYTAEEAERDPEFVRDLPPELVGGLTFHLPLVIQALEVLGGRRPQRELTESELANAFDRGMVDPPFYRWAVDAYEDVALDLVSGSTGTKLAALERVEELGSGLAGAAFHGLIRLGYGASRSDPREVARGLAYMRTRRQVLQSDRSPSLADSHVPLTTPSKQVLEGATIFDQFNLVAGEPIDDRPEPDATPASLLAAAIRLFHSQPSSFVTVHMLTSLHALVEVTELVVPGASARAMKDSPLASWWRSMQVAHAVATRVVKLQGAGTGRHSVGATRSLTTLVYTCVDSSEIHTIKVATSMLRLHGFGLVDDDAAAGVLEAKLSCDDR